MRFATNIPNAIKEEVEALLMEPRLLIGVDIETISIDYPLPLGVALAIDSDKGFYFFDPRDPLLKAALDVSEVKVFHNAAFDIPILRKLGYDITHYEDVMLLAYSAGVLQKGLDDLSRDIINTPYTSVTTQWKKKDQGNIGIDHVKMAGWSIQHALNTYNLWEKLPKVPLYYEIDRPCLDLVLEMEQWGILIDQAQLTQVEQSVVSRAARLEQELKQELGDINLASNPQAAKALQSKGIVGTRKTKAGKDAVSEESLKTLHNPLTDKFLLWKSLRKTITTYVPAFRYVDYKGRLHTRFGYTNTGRWNSSSPNLQNITRDEKFGETGE